MSTLILEATTPLSLAIAELRGLASDERCRADTLTTEPHRTLAARKSAEFAQTADDLLLTELRKLTSEAPST